MQSRNLRRPPPAVLAADSLGLLLPGVGEGSLSVRALPLLKGVVVIGGDDNGAVPGNLGLGLPIAEGGGGVGPMVRAMRSSSRAISTARLRHP
jgi:hypothetical protein